MKARGGCAILVCALAALALSASAAAKPGYEVHPGGVELNVFLGERNGYGYSVSAGDGQRVQLLVEKELFSVVTYSVKGRVSSRRIEADFGKLGRIDVRVRITSKRSRHSREGNRRCKGRSPLHLRGGYRGMIEFSGEGDVPAISSRRGDVRFTRRFRRICKRQSQKNEGGGKQGKGKRRPLIEIGELRVQAKSEGRTTLLSAFSAAPSSSPAESLGFLLGATSENRERVRIARVAIELFSLGIAVSRRGKDPETVRVEPEEAPFAGQALYSRSPGSPAEWTGDLSAKLPGAGPVPFTGPDFTAAFCRGYSFEKVNDCFARRNSQSQPLALFRLLEGRRLGGAPHGSGSHSQPLALARLSSLR